MSLESICFSPASTVVQAIIVSHLDYCSILDRLSHFQSTPPYSLSAFSQKLPRVFLQHHPAVLQFSVDTEISYRFNSIL